MANRNRTGNNYNANRRGEFNRNYGNGYGRSSLGSVNPWQGGNTPGVSNSTEATLMLANNLINNLLSNRSTNVPSLLDINVRRDFGYNQGYGDRRPGNRMGGGGVNNRRPGNNRQSNSASRKGNKQADKPKTPKKEPNSQGEEQSVEVVPTESDVKMEGGPGTGEGGEEQPQQVGGEGEKAVEKKSTPYDDINAIFLVCHICEKKMWDGRSFDNHIKGRAHYMMMEKIRESYNMTADAMRQEQRIAELRKERRGNWGNQGHQGKRVYCAMCDLYVAAEGAHRRSPGHQKLKRYLHPSCNVCKKEMPTRIEYEEHKLTPQHMKVLQEKSKEIPQLKNEVMQMSSMQDELALVRNPRNRRSNNRRKGGANAEKVNGEGEAQPEGEEGGEGEAKPEGEEGGEGEAKPEGEEPMPVEEQPPQDDGQILDYIEGDDLSAVTKDNLPKYQPERKLAVSFIQDYSCKQCTLCKKLFDSEETAEVHTRTYSHFQNFIRLLHSKGDFKKQEAQKRDADGIEPAEGEHDNKKARLETSDENIDQSGENWDYNDVDMNGGGGGGEGEQCEQQPTEACDAQEPAMEFNSQEHQQDEVQEEDTSFKRTPGRPRRNAAIRGNTRNRI